MFRVLKGRLYINTNIVFKPILYKQIDNYKVSFTAGGPV